jgi:hypothetical protein
MGGIDMDYYRKLLSDVHEIMEANASLYIPQSEYNIFNVLEVTEKEVIMCRFLTDLLNPEGQHGCGILFLKSFFENVLKKEQINDILLTYTKVVKEYGIDDERRIDIAIYNSRFFIPMEVKIYAGEQECQCYDYYTYGKLFDDNVKIIYLTRYGTIPTEYSRKAKNGTEILPIDKIICISWEKDIYEWLSAFLVQLDEPIKSLVSQYIDAIRFIADRREDRIMENCMNILYESSDFFNAGVQIEKIMKSAKLKLMRLVFDNLKTEMNKIAPKFGLELENKFNYYSYEDIKRHEKFYDSANSTYPGLNYVIKKAKFKKANLQMWFRIEIAENLYAGITLFDTEAEPQCGYSRGYEVDSISAKQINEAAKYLNKDIIMPTDWWLTWCYPNGKLQDDYYADVPNFKDMNQCAINLVNIQNRTEFVENAVKVFEKQLLNYLL